MQNILSNSHVALPDRSSSLRPPVAVAKDEPCLSFSTGQMVFRTGDERQVYRVESGAVCHYTDRANGAFSLLDFVFPGELVGLGYLQVHTSNALAMVHTTVLPVSAAELELSLLTDDRLSYMLADAGERDFDFLRAKTLAVAPLAPVQRLANYLLAVLGFTRGERCAGELIISDDITSDYVAAQLGISVDSLAMALLSLRRSGVVDVSQLGLRVLNVNRLESIAGAS